MKAGKWMIRRIFTSFYLRDLCNQVDVLHKVELWELVNVLGLSLFSLSFSSPFPFRPSLSAFVRRGGNQNLTFTSDIGFLSL